MILFPWRLLWDKIVRLNDIIQQEYIELRLDEIRKKNRTTEKLATPIFINGVEFDGSQSITISASGGSTIGGLPIIITNAENEDVLMFDATLNAWVDVNKSAILDGGNF